MGIIKFKYCNPANLSAGCFMLNAVFFWDVAVAAVTISPDVEAVVIQQPLVGEVDYDDVPLPCDGAGGVYNNTSYDFYNNIFFAVLKQMSLFQRMQ